MSMPAASAGETHAGADPSAAEHHQMFSAWMASRGATIHSDLDLFAALPGGARGVVARRPIPRGETLLAVPKAACMYVSAGSSADEGAGTSSAATPAPAALHTIEALDPPPSNFMATVLLLLAEYAAGPASVFAAYMATLPPGHDALTAWTPAELALLQGTALEWRGGDTAADIFAREVAPLIEAHPATWPPERCDAAAFVWALGVVQSRAFRMGDGSSSALEVFCTSKEPSNRMYMIPGVDMLNHSSDAARATELRAVVDDAEGAFLMVAERDIAAGEEVRHSYGALSDAQLLQTFGFVEFRADGGSGSGIRSDECVNPHNTVHVASELVAEAAQTVGGLSEAELEERTDALRAAGLLAAVREVPVAAPLSDELLTVSQVLLMPREAFDAWSKAGGGSGVLGAAALEEHPDLGAAACVALLRAVQAALKRLPDEGSSGEAATWRERCAARLREEQRRGLALLKSRLGEALCVLDDGDDDGESDEGDEGSSSEEGYSSEEEASEEEEEEEEEDGEEQQQQKKRPRRS